MRTPLLSILGWSEFLQQHPQLKNEMLPMLQAIEASGRRLLFIVNNILDYSKSEKQKEFVFEHIPFDLVRISLPFLISLR